MCATKIRPFPHVCRNPAGTQEAFNSFIFIYFEESDGQRVIIRVCFKHVSRAGPECEELTRISVTNTAPVSSHATADRLRLQSKRLLDVEFTGSHSQGSFQEAGHKLQLSTLDIV